MVTPRDLCDPAVTPIGPAHAAGQPRPQHPAVQWEPHGHAGRQLQPGTGATGTASAAWEALPGMGGGGGRVVGGGSWEGDVMEGVKWGGDVMGGVQGGDVVVGVTEVLYWGGIVEGCHVGVVMGGGGPGE